MAKPFKNLRDKMSPQAQKASEEKAKKMLSEMPLQELRKARQLSQKSIAEVLSTEQANISRLEQRTDMYISTLRSYIEAMGGQLDIIARFPDGEVHISQFKEIESLQNSKSAQSSG
ncbi:MAG: XRE family transcriptional regulator [Gammaproteobacteria bacterium]|jgi:transcriptional regulator with XRE-family HTH domain|nr:XRE family transcriptional regulator [Gammaproteobacteria bacterium]